MAESEAQMYSSTLVRRVDQIVDSMDGLSPDEVNQPPPVPEANSLAVLAVHTMANVEENIFEIIGGQDVGRNREEEFRVKGKTAEEIKQDWESLRQRVIDFLNNATPEMLDREYEHFRRGKITGRKVLLSATVHAAEHAGHAELTRDWLKSQR
jgi:hypothetical protein